MSGAHETRLDDVLPVNSFANRFPDIASESSLRWQIFNRETNGLDEAGAIVKRGRRVFIVVPKYRDWLLK